MARWQFSREPLFRFGVICIGFALLAFVTLFVYDHGLEDVPFWLYMGIWITFPLGTLSCLVSILLRYVRRRD